MGDSSSERRKQERALRAIHVSAISDFVEDNRRLKESCLVLCNSCRECTPLNFLRVDSGVPPTLLAVFWSGRLCAEAESASRVLPPRKVLEVKWTFDDLSTRDQMDGDLLWEEEDEEEKAEEEKKKQEEEKPKEQEEKEKEEEEVHQEQQEKEEGEEEENEDNEKNGSGNPGPGAAYDVDMTSVRWPEGLRKISLVRFNRPVDGIIWPNCLEVLAFHITSRTTREVSYSDGTTGIFNRPLDGVTFPAGLREISLGHEFDQPISGVTWPEGLKRLSIPGFNRPINDVQWPSGLKTLEFIQPGEFEHRECLEQAWTGQERGFDQPLGAFLPRGLETLWLSDTFDQPLHGVAWPSGLAVLGLGTAIKAEHVNGVSWPRSLRKLEFTNCFFDLPDVSDGCKVSFVPGHASFSDNDPDEFNVNPMNDVLLEEPYDGDDYGDYDSPGSDFSL